MVLKNVQNAKMEFRNQQDATTCIVNAEHIFVGHVYRVSLHHNHVTLTCQDIMEVYMMMINLIYKQEWFNLEINKLFKFRDKECYIYIDIKDMDDKLYE